MENDLSLVHIFVHHEKIYIELYRYNLTFKIENNMIESNEFRGMIISKSQKLDTLLGLEMGLVLCEKENYENLPRKRKLIVPHGMLSIEYNEKLNHQLISIDIRTLRSPTSFTFDIDDRLRILRAGESTVA